ncbi:hypothetical protein B0H11DRAFT_1919691 [Mycena galericulata]|nr:hypothetical protein B0H11DRAFT_1919691 [Mycena galericulata]
MPRQGRAGPKEAENGTGRREELRDLHRARGRPECTSDVGDHTGPAPGPRHRVAGEHAVADGGQLNLMPSRPDHAELEAVEPHLFFKFSLQMLGGIQTPDGETQYSGPEGDIIDKRNKKMRVEMQ